jgi:hypothetical protein
MSTAVLSWRCKCGARLKVLGETDQDQPLAVSVARCPECLEMQVIHCCRIHSVTVEREEATHGSTSQPKINAHTESCSTKTRLLGEWHNAAKAYSRSVTELAAQIGELSQGDYDKLKQVAERARLLSTDAKTRLEGHILEHGCGGAV